MIPPAWSLSLELFFYALAPFIVKRSTLVIILIVAASISLRGLLYFYGHSQDPWGYRFFPNEIAVFCGGILSYRFYKSNYFTQINTLKMRRQLTAVIAVSTLTFGIFLPIHQFIATLTYLLVLGFSLPFLFYITKENRWDKMIGELSYPVYLVHWTVLNFLSRNQIESYKAELGIILSTVLSIILIYFVASPVERYRERRVIALN